MGSGDVLGSQPDVIRMCTGHCPEGNITLDGSTEVSECGAMQCREDETSGAQCPRKRMSCTGANEVGAASDDTALWSAHQFVGAEGHESSAICERLPRSRLATQPRWRTIGEPGACSIEQARADVCDDRDIEGRELCDRCLFDESFDSKIRRMHFQNQCDVVVLALDRLAVVGGTCAIRRPDIDQASSGLLHHFGNAKTAADFDAFASADDDIAITGKGGENEHDRCSIVVDDDGILRSAQPGKEPAHPGLSAPSLARQEIELEVLCTSTLAVCQWSATEIGVGDDSGRIDDRDEKARRNLFGGPFCVGGIAARNRFASRIDEERMGQSGVHERASQSIDTGRTISHPDQRYCASVILFLLFVIMPIVELYTIIRMSSYIGFFNTLAVMFVVAVVGSWLVKREGLRVWRRFNESVAAGKVPTRDIVDGVLILGAGALLLTPGFFSDIFGLLMLFPPSRAAFRGMLMKRSRRNIIVIRRSSTIQGDIIDTDATDVRGDLP
jgi:UPF0716 protein FxsA